MTSNNKQNRLIRKISSTVKSDVQLFLKEEENSRCLPGKKDCITIKKVKKQKQILLADMNVLYQKLLSRCKYKLSYASFCRLRPFWIVKLDVSKRETCLYQKYDNFELLLKILHRNKLLESSVPQKYIELCCCVPYTANCLHGKCSHCKKKVITLQDFDRTEIVTYKQWAMNKVQ